MLAGGELLRFLNNYKKDVIDQDDNTLQLIGGSPYLFVVEVPL